MESEITSILEPPAAASAPDCEHLKARWARLTTDFARLPAVDIPSSRPFDPKAGPPSRHHARDVGALLLLGHDAALADAERYVAEGHTIRTGQVVEFDDVDDEDELDRWAEELDRASQSGWAPPAPSGFWASFLRWRTPLGMARLTERRLRTPIPRPD